MCRSDEANTCAEENSVANCNMSLVENNGAISDISMQKYETS